MLHALTLILAVAFGSSLARGASNPADQFASFKVRIDVSIDRKEGKEGSFVMEVFPAWAPNAAARIHKIIEDKAWENSAFFRYMDGVLIQWGIPGDPKVSSHYRTRTISDDTPRWSNLNGTISFGANGANSRSIQVFANIGDNGATFDAYHNHGFPPFAKVVQGWDVLLSVYKGYKEKPDMYKIEHEGNKYLEAEFPMLSYIKKVTLLDDKAKKEL